jgi:HlyD family secretion protein
MKTYYYIIGIVAFAVVVVIGFKYSNGTSKAEGLRGATVTLGDIDEHIAARGRVEGISEEIKVTSKLAGRLREVRVEEGNHLKQGDVIAVLENDDLLAAVHGAEAQLKDAEARLEKVLNGARQQERDEARAAMEEARAAEENTRSQYDRWSTLYKQGGYVSKERVEEVESNWKMAKGRLDAATERYRLITAPARREDVDMARAQMANARAQLEASRVNYENSFIRAPIAGVVLKKYLKPGESIIAFDRSSAPVISMTDDSVLRVRAEVDESDVNKIRLGQRAAITADAYGSRVFQGAVVRIGNSIGKKNIRTDDPTEKVDTEILETLIQLDPNERIQIGLRVDVRIQIAKKDHVLLLPRAAIRADAEGQTVVSFRGNSVTPTHRVQVGACDGLNCEIVTGLKEGDKIQY